MQRDGSTAARAARLVAPSARRVTAVLVVAGATTTAVLGRWSAGGSRPGRLDAALARGVPMREGPAGVVGEALADLGGPGPVGVALLAMAVVASRSHGPRGVALVLIGPPLAMVTTSLVLKPLVGRTLDGHLAYPSGHTTAAASTAVAAAVLLLGCTTVPRRIRGAGVAAPALLVVGIAVSLVGRGYHYPTDTVGGVAVALAVVLGVALAIDVVADQTSPEPEPRVLR